MLVIGAAFLLLYVTSNESALVVGSNHGLPRSEVPQLAGASRASATFAPIHTGESLNKLTMSHHSPGMTLHRGRYYRFAAVKPPIKH
jgi:hypothetical protein